MSNNWSWYIIILTAINILACFWLIRWNSQRRAGDAAEGDTTGHTWDGDLQEYNNPLPRWWLWLFYITIGFAIIYLIIYPGMGKYKGTSKWTEVEQYKEEMAAADKQYGPIFAAYAKQPIPELAKDAKAMATGQRLFLTYCAVCHGSDAGGATGFPNLTDSDWLYGGDPATIQTTILDGRNGIMPPWGSALSAQQVDDVVAYVLSLSGRETDTTKVEAGKQVFQTYCVACHGADGKGNPAMGAANLTDKIWLYGGSPGTIKQTIVEGRTGIMPAHREFLGEEKVHLLAAYVYSLSHGADK
ncbi:MAG: cytochrome-c oxidase, cbb3-type subunit III [Gammaproteobacteria bacterium]|nr:cytochrome-c oxidase, cbb3-type subunit III [Gammaproteobacteria bacterium]